MEKFMVYGTVTVTCWTEVEAKTKEDAIEKAKKMDLANHHISISYGVDEFFHFENDGVPTELYIDEE